MKTTDIINKLRKCANDQTHAAQANIMFAAANEIERLQDSLDWWSIIERFLQAAGIEPLSPSETVPEQIERGILRVSEMRKMEEKSSDTLSPSSFCGKVKSKEKETSREDYADLTQSMENYRVAFAKLLDMAENIKSSISANVQMVENIKSVIAANEADEKPSYGYIVMLVEALKSHKDYFDSHAKFLLQNQKELTVAEAVRRE